VPAPSRSRARPLGPLGLTIAPAIALAIAACGTGRAVQARPIGSTGPAAVGARATKVDPGPLSRPLPGRTPDTAVRLLASRSAEVGLSRPVVVSPPGVSVSDATVAIGAHRTAVVWAGVRSGPHGPEEVIQARLGPNPQQLGRTTDVDVGAPGGAPHAAVTPTGAVVACWNVVTEAPDGPLDCAVAPPGHDFAAVRELAPTAGGLTGVAADPFGRVVVVWEATTPDDQGTDLDWSVRAPDGSFSTPRGIGANAEDEGAGMAIDRAGTIAVGWITPDTGQTQQEIAAATLPPRATEFTRPTVVIAPRFDPNVPTLAGGNGLAILSDSESRTFFPVIASLGPDGDWNAPVVPVTPPGTTGSEDDLVLPRDGSAMLLSATVVDENSDCASAIHGHVDAAVLPPRAGRLSPPVRLSDPTQIAEGPDAVALADGGVLTVWSDDAGGTGQTELEYSWRTPGGAFDRPTPLPGASWAGVTLVADGNRAALAWLEAPGLAGPNKLVVATLRTRPPFVTPAPRPLHPSAPCD
jgi:hypothetical protein